MFAGGGGESLADFSLASAVSEYIWVVEATQRMERR